MNQHLKQLSAVHYDRGSPGPLFENWLEASDHREQRLLAVDFELPSPWAGQGASTSLTAVYLAGCEAGVKLMVTDQRLADDGPAEAQALFDLWQSQCAAVAYWPGKPLPLEPLSIPKPWGQEIWYTGIEERGVCQFVDGHRRTPIPWLQAAVPDHALGPPGTPPVLLKILDPSAEPVTGDLYFELHDEKREVYVVTHVDPEAWPDGVGAIRYGFDPERVAAAGSDNAFRAQYLEAVRAYERVRRALDALPPGEEASADVLSEEARLRANMDAFTAMRPLRVGDVVRVPLLLPHSLQHGVRTVEFQTPVYERQILSFAQKVLTQDHWDTAEAVQRMTLVAPPPEPFDPIAEQPGMLVERIVDFEDFEVCRARLAGTVSWLPSGNRYSVVMVISGALALPGLNLGPEQAAMLPAGFGVPLQPAEGGEETVVLVASPRR